MSPTTEALGKGGLASGLHSPVLLLLPPLRLRGSRCEASLTSYLLLNPRPISPQKPEGPFKCRALHPWLAALAAHPIGCFCLGSPDTSLRPPGSFSSSRCHSHPSSGPQKGFLPFSMGSSCQSVSAPLSPHET